ncbi:MAG: transporter substrate-binding domain-containing protein [Gammaproteobacteria bacterium]|nr:transporter substrate-binding domain-containing protein [Gammaproteobacteria bacterium]
MIKLLKQLHSRLLFVLLLIFSAPQSIQAQSNEIENIFNDQEKQWIKNHPVIPIGVDGNWPPIDFIGDNNQFQGITADYINLISKKTNIQFIPDKSSSFKVMLKKVMDGKLKVGASISFKQERAEKLLFSQPFFHVQKVIMTRKEDNSLLNTSALSGKTIAIEDGFLTMRQLQKSYPDITLLPVNSTLEALQKVSWGEADAYVGNQAVASWISRKNQLNNLKIVGDAGLGKGPQNFAVSRNAPEWAPLIKIIDKSLTSISVQEKLNIENRWLGQNQSAPTNVDVLELTAKEKAWLIQHPEINLGVDSSWQPLEYLDEQGRYKGLSSDYMDYFSRQLGITFKTPENIPWMLVIRGLQEKTIDIAPLVAKTEKRSEYLDFTKPYQHFPFVLFNRRGQTLLRGLMDLQGKKLGVVSGYAVSESLNKDYPDLLQVQYQNTQKGLEALSVGEIDAFIDVLAVGGYLMVSGGLSNLQVASSTPYNFEFSIGVRKDWPELTSILNKAITHLPAEKVNEFLKHWLVLPAEKKVDYNLLYWVLGIALVVFLLLSLRARELARVNSILHENRERLSLSLDSAKLGTWEITLPKNGTPKLKWDKTFALHHSIPPKSEQPELSKFYKYISTENIDHVKQTLADYIKGETSELKVEYLTSADNHWISNQGRIFSRDSKGVAHKIVGISQDITEQKEAHLAIEKSSKFKSQFLANMSHEIRTPMNAIVGLGHLLSRTETNEKQSDYINNLQKSAQTLLGLIDDILDLSKIEAGHLNIEEIEFSLEELLNDLANLSVIRITKKVDFIYDMRADVPDVLTGDPFRINQVLTNLVSNSIKFTDSGSIVLKISVLESTENNKHQVSLQFEVIDTGIGISPDKLNKLFDPFVQEDGSTTRKYGGTGLGLSISKQLIELMGGELGAESTQGKGSNFYFRLPFTVMDSQLSKSPLTHPGPDLRGLNVLLVDDNPLSLEILSKTLDSMSFKVTSVSSGKQALELLNTTGNKSFDIVLIDWRMPEMDGEKTIQQIRKQIPKEKLPVIIMMTAYGREAGEQQINHMVLDGFLVKPITPSQLFNAIILARKGVTSQSVKSTHKISQEPVLITPISGHVLLAEDNKINQQVAQEILQQMGLKVSICENGQEVIQSLENINPDLILMDIQMPEMDGYEATEIIRNNPAFSQLPIIAMTANAMAGDIEKSRQTGMNDHISKPVDPQLLYQTLKQYLPESTEHKTEQTISSGSIKNWPDEVPGLNIKKGIQQVGGNENLYQKLIKDFLKNHENLTDSLKSSMLNEDSKKAARLVHTIKGVSGNIGAYKLMDVVSSIDLKFKNREKVPQSIISLLDKTCNELFTSLHELTDSANQEENKDIPSPLKIKTADLNQLKSAMEKGDATTLQLLQEHSPALSTEISKEDLNTIINFIEDYEFELALKHLDLCLNQHLIESQND